MDVDGNEMLHDLLHDLLHKLLNARLLFGIILENSRRIVSVLMLGLAFYPGSCLLHGNPGDRGNRGNSN